MLKYCRLCTYAILIKEWNNKMSNPILWNKDTQTQSDYEQISFLHKIVHVKNNLHFLTVWKHPVKSCQKVVTATTCSSKTDEVFTSRACFWVECVLLWQSMLPETLANDRDACHSQSARSFGWAQQTETRFAFKQLFSQSQFMLLQFWPYFVKFDIWLEAWINWYRVYSDVCYTEISFFYTTLEMYVNITDAPRNGHL